MERLRFADKRILIILPMLVLAGIVANLIPAVDYMPHHLSAFCYIALIILWGMTLRRRLPDSAVSRRIIAACILMLLLFFLRICKFSFFPTNSLAQEYLWYLYYVPMTAIPLFMFTAALHMEPVENSRRVKLIGKLLIIPESVVCAVVLTNDLHGQVFDITVPPDVEYSRRWFYYVTLVWILVLGLGALYVMMKKCVISSAKRLWYVPLLFVLAGVAMLILYGVCGGAPRIAGRNIYHLQEAFCLPFIAGVESLILIGVLPANSGYEALFDLSGIHACIYDNGGKPVLHSRDWTEDAADENHRIRREPVTGGYVSWVEDLTAISRLNREIEEVTEELEDENDLIRQEKEIHAERVRYETKNRLYNRIASAVQPQAIRVNELLSGAESEEDEQFHEDLKYAAVLSAYIKRMGNLMLLTDGQAELSTAELKMAFAESIDYIKLMGCECELIGKGEHRIPARLALLSYELFEAAIEDVRSRLHTCMVVLDAEEDFEMTVMLDARAEGISSACLLPDGASCSPPGPSSLSTPWCVRHRRNSG